MGGISEDTPVNERVIMERFLFRLDLSLPGVAKHYAPGGQEVAFIDIIHDKAMGNRCRA